MGARAETGAIANEANDVDELPAAKPRDESMVAVPATTVYCGPDGTSDSAGFLRALNDNSCNDLSRLRALPCCTDGCGCGCGCAACNDCGMGG